MEAYLDAYVDPDDGVAKIKGTFTLADPSFAEGLVRVGYRKYVCDSLEEFVERVTPFDEDKRPHMDALKRLVRPPRPFCRKVDWDDDMPASATDNIKPYQREVVNDVVERLDGRAVVAMEPGTGKTFVASVLIRHYDCRTLILVPNFTDQWVFELRKWVGLDAFVVPSRKATVPPEAKYVVCTYSTARDNPHVLAIQWSLCVADESHMLKNPASLQSKKLLPLLASAPRALLLSGTPLLSSHWELYTQLSVLHPVFGTWYDFTKRYCDGKQGPQGSWEARGSRYGNELRAFMSTMSVRVRRKDVLNLMPRKREIVRLPTTEEVKAEFTKDIGRLRALQRDADKSAKAKNELDTLVNRMAERSGVVKTEEICKWLRRKLSEDDEKLVIFAKHRALVSAIEECVKEMGLTYIKVDGQTSMKKRHAMFESIRVGLTRIAIMSIGACATAINLAPGAFRVVFAEMDFCHGIMDQAECRVDRLNSVRQSEYFYLLGDGTYDQYVFDKLRKKSAITARVMDGMGSTFFLVDRSYLERLGVTESHRVRVPLIEDEPFGEFLRRCCARAGEDDAYDPVIEREDVLENETWVLTDLPLCDKDQFQSHNVVCVFRHPSHKRARTRR